MAEQRRASPVPVPGWAGRLRDLLGAAPHALQLSDLQRIVNSGVREDEQLDFKRVGWGNGDSDRRELAGDLASLANHRGGLILVGIAEADGAASELVGAPLADKDELRIRQIAAALIQPYLSFDVVRVEGDDDASKECFALLVAPSPLAPHCVRKDADLRFPRRNGTSTRYLTESEVADAYRSRFSQTADERSRLRSAVDDAVAELDHEEGPWRVATLVPTQSSAIELDSARLQEMQSWLSRHFGGDDRLSGFLDHQLAGMRVGRRRAVLQDPYDGGGKAKWRYAELHTDGTAVAARQLGWREEDVASERPYFLSESELTWATAQVLGVVARHARDNVGAFGDALVELELVGPLMGLARMGYMRGELVRGTRAQTGTIVSQRTLALGDLVDGPPTGLLVAVRMLLTELLHAFGQAESRFLTPEGALLVGPFGGQADGYRGWAQTRGIVVAD